MKFSNGCWLQKEGCSCFAPAEAYFTKIEEKKVTITCPAEKLAYYDPYTRQMQVEKMEYELYIGTSEADADLLKGSISLG